MVPLRGEKSFTRRPKTGSWYLFGVLFSQTSTSVFFMWKFHPPAREMRDKWGKKQISKMYKIYALTCFFTIIETISISMFLPLYLSCLWPVGFKMSRWLEICSSSIAPATFGIIVWFSHLNAQSKRHWNYIPSLILLCVPTFFSINSPLVNIQELY